jgi:Fe-S cluster assembly ATPase SufC
MSVKNNGFLAEIATANAAVFSAPIVDSMVNDLTIDAAMASDLMDGSGKAIAAVIIGSNMRPVADTSGNVRLFKSGAAAIAALRRICVGNGLVFQYTKQVKSGSLGDPIKTLISKYKSCKTEELAAIKQAVDEWKTSATTRKASLEAALTAADINLVTLQPN